MAKAIHCAAIDLGATSGRVIVGAWSSRGLHLREVHRFANQFRTLNGSDYWDLGGLWQEIQQGLARAAASLPRGAKLASVGVDAWGVDHVLVDARGRQVFPTHAYRDARTQPGLRALAAHPRVLARLYAATGIPNLFYNTSLQLAESVRSYPALRRTAARCLFLPDYFNFLLSGRMANEVSISSTSQLLGVSGPAAWSRFALDHFDVPAEWFRPPLRGQTVLGPVRGQAALAGTLAIAVPGHDTACAYDAMPASAGSLYLSSGTWSLIGFESDSPVLGPKALAAGLSNERTGDGAYRPVRNMIGLWLLEGLLKDFAARPSDAAGWEKLIAAAERSPAPAVLVDVDDAAFANPPSMRAAIDAHLRGRRSSPPRNLAGYVRLICDSLGRGHAQALAQLQGLSGRSFGQIVMVGGGARNRLLGQATADAARVPVVAADLEGAATGNVARQLLALGAVESLAAFRARLVGQLTLRRYEPRN
jgi:rhamnulokinase